MLTVKTNTLIKTLKLKIQNSTTNIQVHYYKSASYKNSKSKFISFIELYYPEYYLITQINDSHTNI